MKTPTTVSAQQLADQIRQRGVDVIDVRTPAEFREVHIASARNVPLPTLDPQEVMGNRDKNTPLYVICQAGSRGASACQKLLDEGYDNVVNVEGGTRAWIEAGLPVVRGRRSVSLERQVRIAAGLLVLLGAALGYFVSLHFIGLSALVGAGLVFAGVTDWCGMALFLAKMPWNQSSQSC